MQTTSFTGLHWSVSNVCLVRKGNCRGKFDQDLNQGESGEYIQIATSCIRHDLP